MKEIIQSTIESEKHRRPISVGIFDEDNIDAETRKELELVKKNGDELNWDEEEDAHRKNNMKTAGQGSYIISEGNEKSTYSLEYGDCLGFVLVGEDQEGKEISFMAHLKPRNALDENQENFLRDLSERANDFLAKVDQKSIDARIFGGRKGGSEYKKYIKLLGSILQEIVGFEPRVATGPNLVRGMTDVFFDTKNRHLYIKRPDQENSKLNEDYLPSEIEEKSKEWFG